MHGPKQHQQPTHHYIVVLLFMNEKASDGIRAFGAILCDCLFIVVLKKGVNPSTQIVGMYIWYHVFCVQYRQFLLDILKDIKKGSSRFSCVIYVCVDVYCISIYNR